MKKELTLLDRIILTSIVPTKGDIVTLTLSKDLTAKIAIKQEEIKEYGISAAKKVGLGWNESGAKAKFEIEFSELEANLIKSELQKLDSSKKLSIDMLGLVKLFIP